MAKDELTGNMPTENLIGYLNKHNIPHGLNEGAFFDCMKMAEEIFPSKLVH